MSPATATKQRKKTAALPVPKTAEEAELLLADIGRAQRQVSTIENRMNDRLAKIKQEFEEQAKPLNDEIEEKFAALHAWAESNKENLLKGKAKTAKLATGELSWRTTPPSVSIRNQKVVLEILKQRGLNALIRSKDEVNKEAILADPSQVKDIKQIVVKQREEFVAKPYESAIEKVETITEGE
jgi:phage host-nuclease inhibitor protein Gam